MSGMILLIDYENVQKVDLSRLPSDADIRFFVGAKQPKVTMTVGPAQMAGRMDWIQIDGQGKDALDFHIAYYLGRYFSENPKACCVILSKDTGFDPLVRHLVKHGHDCRRVAQLASLLRPAPTAARATRDRPQAPATNAKRAAPPPAKTKEFVPSRAPQPVKAKPAASPDANFKRVVDLLHKIENNRRPHTRTKLTKWVAAAFQNKLPKTEVERIMRALIAAGIVVEANKELTYKL